MLYLLKLTNVFKNLIFLSLFWEHTAFYIFLQTAKFRKEVSTIESIKKGWGWQSFNGCVEEETNKHLLRLNLGFNLHNLRIH